MFLWGSIFFFPSIILVKNWRWFSNTEDSIYRHDEKNYRTRAEAREMAWMWLGGDNKSHARNAWFEEYVENCLWQKCFWECSLGCFCYAVSPTLHNFHLWYDPACSPSWCHSCERVIHSISFLWTSEGGEKCAPNHQQAELAALQQLSLSLARWAVLAWLHKNEGPPRNLMQVKRTTKSSFINSLKTFEENTQRSREKMRQHIDTKNGGNGQHPWIKKIIKKKKYVPVPVGKMQNTDSRGTPLWGLRDPGLGLSRWAAGSQIALKELQNKFSVLTATWIQTGGVGGN